jgi:hypothetical protein
MKIDYGNDINKKKKMVVEMKMRKKKLIIKNIIK